MRPADPHILGPGLLPTPFTADEIRQGCPDGRRIRLLVEIDGKDPFLRTNRFDAVDADGATITSRRLAMDGTPLAPAEADRTTWRQLQEHASFPADRTTITLDVIELPIGTLECLRYTRTDGATTSTFWFAKSAPGMPVRYTTEVAGHVTSTVTMVENTLA